MNLKPWLALAVLSTTMPSAMATVINFDGLANGTIVDNEYYDQYGITFNGINVDEGEDNLAVVFDTTLSNTEDPDLEGTFSNSTLGDLDAGNVLIIHENPSSCDAFTCTNPDDEGSRPAGYFSIDFENGVTLNSIDFFDIESEAETVNNEINLFDINGLEINAGDFYTPGTGGDNTWDTYSFNISDVYSLEINLFGSGAISNLNFTATAISPTAVSPTATVNVPAPTTIGLLSIALLGLVSSRRRRTM